VYDWDNVFWPTNLLLAQETGRSTFSKQAELFLKNWICAGNVANYTAHGRAYNPWSGARRSLPLQTPADCLLLQQKKLIFIHKRMSQPLIAPHPLSTGSLGTSTSAAAMALMYADLAEHTSTSLAREYRCWALSQVRYVLGDAGRSLVVGYGKNPPKRTQDRAAACPDAPQVRLLPAGAGVARQSYRVACTNTALVKERFLNKVGMVR
jgi:hypothetical protein